MALLNRPMTKEEIDIALAAPIAVFCDFAFNSLFKEEMPHLVNYEALRGISVYTSPRDFYFHSDIKSPSDSTWIVPGTLYR